MMFKMDPEIEKLLYILGFKEITKYPRMKDVIKMFRKTALKTHPDKPGGSTENFQQLQDAFRRTGSYLENFSYIDDMKEEEEAEEDVARKLFKEFYLNGEKFESSFLHIFKDKEKEAEHYLSHNNCKMSSFLSSDSLKMPPCLERYNLMEIWLRGIVSMLILGLDISSSYILDGISTSPSMVTPDSVIFNSKLLQLKVSDYSVKSDLFLNQQLKKDIVAKIIFENDKF